MARIARMVAAQYPHHIVQRGNNKQPVFFDDTDRELYIILLRKYALECACRIVEWLQGCIHAFASRK